MQKAENSSTSDTSPPPNRLLLDHQREPLEKLLSVARACFAISRNSFGIQPRCNTLIVGPSGSGKSHLARLTAEELGVPILTVSTADWIPVGCSGRGAVPTWPMIFNFLDRHHKKEGLVIFLDEVDKIGGDTTWNGYLRNEAFSLLDLRIPEGIIIDDDQPSKESFEIAQSALRNRTLLIAAGAFQDIWEQRSIERIGFGVSDAKPEATELSHLTSLIPRELANRFRADLIVLPQLQRPDYERMLDRAAEQLPPYLRNTFLRLGNKRIAEALRCRLGCRFAEELLLDTIMEERAQIRSNSVPATSEEPDCMRKKTEPESKPQQERGGQ